MYRGPIRCTSLKLITQVISLGFRTSEPQYQQPTPRETHPKFGWGRYSEQKPAISPKWGKIRPLLMTNVKLHTLYRLVPESMTLYDLERPFRTVSKYMRFQSPLRKAQ